MPHFDTLALLLDREPRGAALNMAMDEVLLEEISVPTLRAYRWRDPSVSFGYFERFTDVENAHPGRDLVRRWTGGGVVLHGEDFTYALLVPRDCEWMKTPPAQSYLLVHECIAHVMRECGVGAFMAAAPAPKMSTACFENAVRHDLLLDNRKIAGAAQRRTRHGLLHQGSILGAALPGDFAERLARKLAANVIPGTITQNTLSAANTLAESKYATSGWMRKF